MSHVGFSLCSCCVAAPVEGFCSCLLFFRDLEIPFTYPRGSWDNLFWTLCYEMLMYTMFRLGQIHVQIQYQQKFTGTLLAVSIQIKLARLSFAQEASITIEEQNGIVQCNMFTH
ncbi:hypothetical protein Y1Q_0021536 [Alligator mississippiensis]|uniref:Uncharacterized protein n=1 Tax=Alligator mississippiensis TaxID=8496 RepID=A0A151PA05_ALLMI|nr:hypothetical protein Y1Q_0021536 [Alligator mississippiensis]